MSITKAKKPKHGHKRRDLTPSNTSSLKHGFNRLLLGLNTDEYIEDHLNIAEKIILSEARNRKSKAEQEEKLLVIQKYLDRDPKQRSQHPLIRNYLDRHPKPQQSQPLSTKPSPDEIVNRYINQRIKNVHIHHGDADKEQKEEINTNQKQLNYYDHSSIY